MTPATSILLSVATNAITAMHRIIATNESAARR